LWAGQRNGARALAGGPGRESGAPTGGVTRPGERMQHSAERDADRRDPVIKRGRRRAPSLADFCWAAGLGRRWCGCWAWAKERAARVWAAWVELGLRNWVGFLLFLFLSSFLFPNTLKLI